LSHGPDAIGLLVETGQRHAFFGLELSVRFGSGLHLTTLTRFQVLHVRFESFLNNPWETKSMGAILAVFADEPYDSLRDRMEAMLSTSIYRGQGESWVGEGVVIAIQSLGWDASLVVYRQWTVAFHGYIGNWGEIGREHGMEFAQSENNASKFCKAYALLGRQLFSTLRGEFSSLIYDAQKKSVLVVRDVIGTRPAFYWSSSSVLIIATEIRQVLAGAKSQRALNDHALAGYLMNQPIPQCQTLDRFVFRVVPGQVYSFDLIKSKSKPKVLDYWQPPFTSTSRHYDEDALEEELRHRLEKSIDRALPCLPFAVTLSGGLDSSSIWSLVADRAASGCSRAAGGKPFSMVHPGMSCDESGLIADILYHTGALDCVNINVSRINPVEYTEPYYESIDGTINNATAFHLPLLAKSARADGRSILILGTGEQWPGGNFTHLADDLRKGHWLDLLNALLWARPYINNQSHRMRFLLNHLQLRRPHILQRQHSGSPNAWAQGLMTEKTRQLAAEIAPVDSKHASESFAWHYLKRSLGAEQSWRFHEPIEQLAALEGVELRQPLQDLDLIAFAFATPARAFTGGVRQKNLMRRAMGDLLPPSMQQLNKKVNFNESAEPFLTAVSAQTSWRLVDEGFLDGSVIAKSRSIITEASASGSQLTRVVPNWTGLLRSYLGERFTKKF
jgi:asparagine synthase (glutamine-hydrolysing)